MSVFESFQSYYLLAVYTKVRGFAVHNPYELPRLLCMPERQSNKDQRSEN